MILISNIFWKKCSTVVLSVLNKIKIKKLLKKKHFYVWSSQV